MKLCSIAVIALAGGVIGTIHAQGARPDARLLPERGVVLKPTAFLSSRVESCSDIGVPDVPPSWTPRTDQIQELDSILGPFLAESLATSGKPLPEDTSLIRHATQLSVSDYYRQYVGIGTKEHPLIFVNGFHKLFFDWVRLADSLGQPRGSHPAPFNWRTTAVVVCDGGVGFFAAIYDPATKTVIEFAFNGVG